MLKVQGVSEGTKVCGNCKHSWQNNPNVLVRLGCHKDYCNWFNMPHDCICKEVAWEEK